MHISSYAVYMNTFDLGNDFWSFFNCSTASSCKVYGVVSAPHQLLVGVHSSRDELNEKTACLTSSAVSSTPTPLVSSFDFVNSDLLVWCFSCDAYLDAQAILQLHLVYETAYILKFGQAPPFPTTDNQAEASTSGNLVST